MWPRYILGGWLFILLIGIALTAAGYLSLTMWIPKLGKQDQIRTEIYAARVSCWMVVFGLVIIAVWALSGIIVRSLVVLKCTGVLP
jgi:amino acid permease